MSGVDTDDAVGIILVDREGRFLLQLRDDIEGIAWPGMWGLVGGAMEEGELPYDAAVREIEEEIGQRIEQLHLVGTVPALWTGRGTLHLYCAGARFADEDIVLGEGQDARFFAPADTLALEPTTPYIRPVVSNFVNDHRYQQCIGEAGELAPRDSGTRVVDSTPEQT